MPIYTRLSEYFRGRLGIICVAIPLPIAFQVGRALTFPLPPDPRAYVGFQSGGGNHGTLDVIWSCLSTIFICVYTSIHENLQRDLSTRRTIFQRLLHRLALTSVGLLAPEVFLGAAIKEWLNAIEITAEMREAYSGHGEIGKPFIND